MLVDLSIEDKNAVIVGAGYEAEQKALKLLDAGARVTVIGEGFNRKLRALASKGSVNLVESNSSRYEELLRSLNPFLVFTATGLFDLDCRVSRAARSTGALVCAVDRPLLNDFNMPAIARIGDIRVAVSTDGLSPGMARVLRKRIERLIKPEDVLQVKLQGHVRRLAKEIVPDQRSRRKLVYRILQDRIIASLLHRKRFEEAKVQAEAIARSVAAA